MFNKMKKIFLIFGILISIALVSAPLGNVEPNCEEIFFFIAESNWKYNETDLINNGITQEQIDNYETDCNDSLPNKPAKNDLIVSQKDPIDCDLDNWLPDASFPFFQTYIGDISCNKAKFINIFLKLENTRSFSITGIRIWWMVSLGFSFISFKVIKSHLKSNKNMDKVTEKFLQEPLNTQNV